MSRRIEVVRQDSSYPSGRRHSVEISWFKLTSYPKVELVERAKVPDRREAESAFKAREAWARELKCDPMDLHVELDE